MLWARISSRHIKLVFKGTSAQSSCLSPSPGRFGTSSMAAIDRPHQRSILVAVLLTLHLIVSLCTVAFVLVVGGQAWQPRSHEAKSSGAKLLGQLWHFQSMCPACRCRASVCLATCPHRPPMHASDSLLGCPIAYRLFSMFFYSLSHTHFDKLHTLDFHPNDKTFKLFLLSSKRRVLHHFCNSETVFSFHDL